MTHSTLQRSAASPKRRECTAGNPAVTPTHYLPQAGGWVRAAGRAPRTPGSRTPRRIGVTDTAVMRSMKPLLAPTRGCGVVLPGLPLLQDKGVLDAARFHTIHLFVVLPEPLDLPSGYAVQKVVSPGSYTGEAFRMWDGSDLTVDDYLAGPFCRFFHRQIPMDMESVNAAIDLATWTWPNLPKGDSEAPSGWMSGSPTLPMKVRTGVELVNVVLCVEPECSGLVTDESLLGETLECGLQIIQTVQRAVHAITRQPYTLLTQAGTPFMTPVAIGTIPGDGTFEPPHELGAWNTNTNILSELPPTELTDDNMSTLATLVNHIDSRTFFGFLDFHREAMVAHRKRGDTRAAAIFLGLACERLLDDLLSHLMWEDGDAPEEAPATFLDQEGIANRVRRAFHPRLKGSGWTTESPGPVADWWNKVAKIRNQVVHGAYNPTDQEIEDGNDATQRLLRFIGDSLVDRINKEGKYRLTAVALLAEASLRRRHAWSRRTQEAVERFNTEDLWALAARWKAAAERQRAAGFGDPVQPDESSAYVMYVAQASGPSYWVQHDRSTSQARQIGRPRDITDEQKHQLLEIDTAAMKADVSGPEEVLIISAHVKTHAPVDAGVLGEWREEYHLIPGAEVMVDGSDRRKLVDAQISQLR